MLRTGFSVIITNVMITPYQHHFLYLTMALLSVLGKNPTGKRLERIKKSPHYSDGNFQNPEPTEVTLKGTSFFKMIKDYRNRPKTTAPPTTLPFVCTDLFALSSDKPTIVWFGHSSYLLKVKGFHILVDPVFSGNASPVSFFAKSFPGSDTYGVDDFPDIDAMIITHDHYDHLDYKTIRQFAAKTRHFFTSLGVGSHLEYWGISPDKITELDWGETAEIDREMTLTATPARHFSGRTMKRNSTLWSSFVWKTEGYSLFLGGDSGYGRHFKAIGDQYGPFDLAILECGQYGKNWPNIHMFPEETATASQDLQAKAFLPVHWGKFTLSLHEWNDPIRRVVKAAAEKGLVIATPLIGDPLTVGENYPRETWWEMTGL
jgi:L-ascorbate metabolism protein UlaG (beta-lactamase superfamily)